MRSKAHFHTKFYRFTGSIVNYSEWLMNALYKPGWSRGPVRRIEVHTQLVLVSVLREIITLHALGPREPVLPHQRGTPRLRTLANWSGKITRTIHVSKFWGNTSIKLSLLSCKFYNLQRSISHLPPDVIPTKKRFIVGSYLLMETHKTFKNGYGKKVLNVIRHMAS